mmetsp:Transcript_44322/g.113177  ORF Transcript_44322/g.113177 Transcript_44322/m.113177 type:complete len:397 (-) Transcript_44322:19-1209(-)
MARLVQLAGEASGKSSSAGGDAPLGELASEGDSCSGSARCSATAVGGSTMRPTRPRRHTSLFSASSAGGSARPPSDSAGSGGRPGVSGAAGSGEPWPSHQAWLRRPSMASSQLMRSGCPGARGAAEAWERSWLEVRQWLLPRALLLRLLLRDSFPAAAGALRSGEMGRSGLSASSPAESAPSGATEDKRRARGAGGTPALAHSRSARFVQLCGWRPSLLLEFLERLPLPLPPRVFPPPLGGLSTACSRLWQRTWQTCWHHVHCQMGSSTGSSMPTHGSLQYMHSEVCPSTTASVALYSFSTTHAAGIQWCSTVEPRIAAGLQLDATRWRHSECTAIPHTSQHFTLTPMPGATSVKHTAHSTGCWLVRASVHHVCCTPPACSFRDCRCCSALAASAA